MDNLLKWITELSTYVMIRDESYSCISLVVWPLAFQVLDRGFKFEPVSLSFRNSFKKLNSQKLNDVCVVRNPHGARVRTTVQSSPSFLSGRLCPVLGRLSAGMMNNWWLVFPDVSLYSQKGKHFFMKIINYIRKLWSDIWLMPRRRRSSLQTDSSPSLVQTLVISYLSTPNLFACRNYLLTSGLFWIKHKCTFTIVPHMGRWKWVSPRYC